MLGDGERIYVANLGEEGRVTERGANGGAEAHLMVASAYVEEQASAELSGHCQRWVRNDAEFEAIVTCRAEQR